MHPPPSAATAAPAERDDPTIWRGADALWARLAPLLRRTTPRQNPGRPRRDDRAIFAGLIWLARTAAPWSQLPRACGPSPPSTNASARGWRVARSNGPGRCCCARTTPTSAWPGVGWPPPGA